MEQALRSKSRIGYATRPPKNSGVVIRDGDNVSNNILAHTQIPNHQESFKRDTNLYLPMANIIKIMRSTLPENAKIADGAKETIQECVSGFIDYITREANAICHQDYRKTITAEDLVFAMETTKFHDYAATLTQLLRKQREEDLAHNFMLGKSLVRPNFVVSDRAQDQVAQQQVDNEPQNGLTDPMDFDKPNFGEGSSSGSMDAGFDFPSQQFKWKSFLN